MERQVTLLRGYPTRLTRTMCSYKVCKRPSSATVERTGTANGWSLAPADKASEGQGPVLNTLSHVDDMVQTRVQKHSKKKLLLRCLEPLAIC